MKIKLFFTDDWKHELSNITKKIERTKIAAHFNDKQHRDQMKYRDTSPNYNIELMKNVKKSSGTKYQDTEKQFNDDRVSNLMRQQSERYRIAAERGERINYEKEKFYKHDKYLRPNTQSYDMEMSRGMSKSKVPAYNNNNRYPENKDSRYIDMNPYREVESLPYQQSNDMFCRGFHRKSTNETRVIVDSSPALSTMKRTTPRDRFVNAKEKFQAIDRRHYDEKEFTRRSEAYQRDVRQSYSPKRSQNYHDVSSDEDYRDPPPIKTNLLPAKSLGNLARSRHSYAEPLNFFNGCNRVGLARIT